MKLRSMNDYGSIGGFAFALLVSLLLVVGCGGGGGGDAAGGETTTSTGSPKIVSDTSAIDFGNQVIGQMTEREVTLGNTGTANLAIGAIVDPGGVFAVAGDCPNNSLAPNETCKVLVRFTPGEQKPYTGSLRVDSNVENLTIDLTGSGKGLSVGISSITNDCSASTVKAKVLVSDYKKVPVTDLVMGNFKIYLNGKPVVPTSFLASTVAEPVSVALALDWSNSFIDFRPAIMQSAQEFIDLLEDNDSAAVFRFALTVDGAAQPFINVGTGRETLKAAVEAGYSGARKPTMIWDAVNYAVTQTAGETNEKRAVILLSDGQDSNSVTSLQDLIRHARDNNVVVFTIGLGDVDAGVLEQLAQGTGGIHFNALTTDSLQAIYQSIELILTNQYELVLANPSPATPNPLKVAVTAFGWEGEGVREIPSCP